MGIGKNIKELRTLKGVTQEALAEAVGVSGQAVSKWESGGSPDIELLPVIADYFNVSVDRLFGRKNSNASEIEDEVVEYIRSFDTIDERFKKVFNLCWLLELAIYGKKPADNEKDVENFIENNESYINGKRSYGHSQMLLKSGSSSFNLDETLRYFLIMPKPEQGWSKTLHFKEDYVKLFESLADADLLKMLFFFHARNNKPFTPKLIEKELNVTTGKAKEIIKKLIEYNFVTSKEIELDDETQVIYDFDTLFSFIPFLTFAEEIIKRPNAFYCFSGNEKSNPFLLKG